MDRSIEIKHLWSRMGFGIVPDSIILLREKSLHENIEYLFDGARDVESIQYTPTSNLEFDPGRFSEKSQAEKAEFLKTDEDRLNDLRNRWLQKMMTNQRGALLEKLTLFWHGHFACQCRSTRAAASYLNTLRSNALGNFGDLLLQIAKEPAMIRFLNNQQNRKSSPNENFARELLELFTIGEGNYTENDVREASRAFTGWSSDGEDKFMFRARQHDFGQKSFLGRSGAFNGNDIIRIILERRETAFFVAGRFYSFFVSSTQNLNHINELADVFYQSSYDIMSMVRHLVTADWFYDPEHVGNRIKSPIELIVQSSCLFDTSFENPSDLDFLQRSLGELLFDPPNVAGWPGGRNWINNSTLLIRLNLPSHMIHRTLMDHTALLSLKSEGPGKAVQFLSTQCDLESMLSYFRQIEYRELEDSIKGCLLVKTPGPKISSTKEQRSKTYLEDLLVRVTSLPEFQLG